MNLEDFLSSLAKFFDKINIFELIFNLIFSNLISESYFNLTMTRKISKIKIKTLQLQTLQNIKTCC